LSKETIAQALSGLESMDVEVKGGSERGSGSGSGSGSGRRKWKRKWKRK
jgi:hypothetical protein